MSLTSYRAAPPRDKPLSTELSPVFCMPVLAGFAVCDQAGAAPPRARVSILEPVGYFCVYRLIRVFCMGFEKMF